MEIKRFNIDTDLEKLENYLRIQYLENKNMTSWLPERLHDLIYSKDTYSSNPKSSDYIFMWEDNNEIVGCILPDGDAIYMSIKKGYENLFESMVSYAEDNCRPLFKKDKDGSIVFVVIANDSLKYRKKILKQRGYTRQQKEYYDSYVCPQKVDVSIDLPKGFKLVYGNEYNDEGNKWSACIMGFRPDLENQKYKNYDYKNDMGAYISRKKSSMYNDSFECLVIDENPNEKNNVCSYCFVYVDKKSKTAYIETVSTREKYRHKGMGAAMLHGVIIKCKELDVAKCYVNSYGWRGKFYNAAGFITEDTMGCYHRKIKKQDTKI